MVDLSNWVEVGPKVGSVKIYPFLDYIRFLDSITALVGHEFWNVSEQIIVANIHKKTDHTPRNKITEPVQIQRLLDIMESAWLHELALRDSLEKNNIKFVHWDIIKFYYIIFDCVSIIARIAQPELKETTHYKKIEVYNKSILANNCIKKMVITPFFALYGEKCPLLEANKITGWKYGQNHHYPRLKDCLEKTYEEIRLDMQRRNGARIELVSVVDFFNLLRIFANYKGTHIIKYLHGQSYKEDLTHALKKIPLYFLIMTELILIRYIGFEEFKKTFGVFKLALISNHKHDPIQISDRMAMYDIIFGGQNTLNMKI